MNRTTFAILMVLIAVIVLGMMWFAWRSRTRRDAGASAQNPALSGAVIAEFAQASYVSTTPQNSPFERVALPGLRFKGYADLAVHEDGVSISVTGEAPVHLNAAQIRGTSSASGRVGKFVEADGLSVLRWDTIPQHEEDTTRELESSFRFVNVAEQQRFADAIAAIPQSQTQNHHTTQEDA